jgi:hypothetical protein
MTVEGGSQWRFCGLEETSNLTSSPVSAGAASTERHGFVASSRAVLLLPPDLDPTKSVSLKYVPVLKRQSSWRLGGCSRYKILAGTHRSPISLTTLRDMQNSSSLNLHRVLAFSILPNPIPLNNHLLLFQTDSTNHLLPFARLPLHNGLQKASPGLGS